MLSLRYIEEARDAVLACREIAMATGVHPAGSYPMLVRNLQEGFEQSISTRTRDLFEPLLEQLLARHAG